MNEGWNILAIGLGGAAGALCRYGLTKTGLQGDSESIPWGILTANFIGCFLIGLLHAMGQRDIHPIWKLAISVGFIGSLTTFSTLCLDFVVLYQKQPFLAGTYLIASLAGGIGLVLAGQFFARITG